MARFLSVFVGLILINSSVAFSKVFVSDKAFANEVYRCLKEQDKEGF